MAGHLPVGLILILSKQEVVAGSAYPTSWFDKLTMRSQEESTSR